MVVTRLLVRQNSWFDTQHVNESPRYSPRKPNSIIKTKYRNGISEKSNGENKDKIRSTGIVWWIRRWEKCLDVEWLQKTFKLI